MDSSILKLLEEDNEVESMFSKEELDASQVSLLREFEGGNNSSSQQFATQNNGIEDANTNNLHIPESTQMKEERQSVVGNRGQELKPEDEYHAKKKLPQDHRQLWENLSHVGQESNLQPSNNSISTEPERPQPLKQVVISRRTHGLEQPVASLNHGTTQIEICELVRILILQVDKDRGTQLHTLYSKFKRKEITREWFLRQVRGVAGDPVTRWATNKLIERNKGIKVPGGPDYSRESFTSAEFSAKTPDTCGPHQVNFPAAAETILAGSIVRTTPKVPCVGQKKPLEALGSSLPPTSKKQRLCRTSLARSDDKFNDVTALSGINIMEEEKRLLSFRPKEDDGVSKAFRRIVHAEEGRMILQKVPLQRKLAEIMAKSGLKHINDDVERFLSLCVEERIRRLLSDIIRMSKQRTDPEKCRNRTCITSDLRKQINEMNQKAKEEWERKHGGEEKLKNEENDAGKEDNPSEQANKKERERRTKAANVAVLASLGGYNPFSKWKLMAEARQKPSSGPGRNSKNLSGETGGSNQGSPKVVRSISVKDVIAVLEKEPQMSRSTLLYRLCNRIYSDVPTQEKT